MKSLIDNIVENYVIVQDVFVENYSFLIKDAAQSSQWNNNQLIPPTLVYYYRQSQEMKHKSIVMISDNFDTSSHFTFQNNLYRLLQRNNRLPNYIIYYWRGTSFQNKFNFINLLYFSNEFGTETYMHFHAILLMRKDTVMVLVAT